MNSLFSKRTTLVVVAVAVVGGAFAWYLMRSAESATAPAGILESVTSSLRHAVIGQSIEGRTIDAYTYGSGATRLAFVGGVHGGYEWNSILLSYELMEYLSTHPGSIPEDISVTVIPNANPDGVYRALGIEGRFTIADVPTGVPLDSGRFNAHAVDLNRNFDCKWQATSTWKGEPTSAGTAPFSEPEALALRNFVLEKKPEAVVFLHSKAGAVYASECEDGILPETRDIMNAYARAAGYRAIDVFDAYPVTGDAEGWLASLGIPAVTVELETHETVEWERNLAGVQALFAYYKTR